MDFRRYTDGRAATFGARLRFAHTLDFWPHACRRFGVATIARVTAFVALAVAVLASFAAFVANRNPVVSQISNRRVRTEAGGLWLGAVLRVSLRALFVVAVVGEGGKPVGAI